MRAKQLIATVVLGGGILAGGSIIVPALAQSDSGTGPASAASADGRALSLHEVQLGLETMGYRDVTKIDRERDKLEIEATDSQGRRVEIDVDPAKGNVLATEVRRGERDRADTAQGSWLTMHQVQVKLEAMGYRDVEKIERERDGYEAKATTAQGQRVKLAVAPRSGEVIEAREERAARAR